MKNENTDSKQLELLSSAVTLSDMEVFIFPELMFSLLLANIMSPRIWKWREDPWFDGLETMKPYKRITRLKQYIMDHYAFNLDLNTWGLTNVEEQLERFNDFIDKDTLAQSNALFGYEGDKYYFDIDIRTHFGLDKYSGNIIPFWKTETVEAMDAFKYREGYSTGAGECVSLAALYAAALFIVAEIPLEDIYMMATPLHSQNFVLVNDGILTNNRRLVTKNMWFNGTALSAQARRALENERVTIVSHVTGHIHTIYPEATISPAAYSTFSEKLSAFLKTKLTKEILGNFLRQCPETRGCVQIRFEYNGRDHYIPADIAFDYENGSPYKVTDNTRPKLLNDICEEVFEPNPMPNRIILNDLEDFIAHNNIDIDSAKDVQRLKDFVAATCIDKEQMLERLISFCHIKPRLPDFSAKTNAAYPQPVDIRLGMSREEITEHLLELRDNNSIADLAFYAFRDLSRTPQQPYLKACLERNPVSTEACRELSIEQILEQLQQMPDESIYDGHGRLAQPDEVWNFSRGDGLEKAVLLANIIKDREPDKPLAIEITESSAILHAGSDSISFATSKGLADLTWNITD